MMIAAEIFVYSYFYSVNYWN